MPLATNMATDLVSARVITDLATPISTNMGELRTPRSILGSSLHSDFDARYGITLNGSTVSSWANQGIDTAAAVQAVAGKQPAYSATSFAGGPGITGDGTDDILVATCAAPFTIGTRPYAWIVGQWIAFGGANGGALWLRDAGATQYLGYTASATNHVNRRNDSSGTAATNGPAVYTTPLLTEIGFTVGGVATMVVDGVATNTVPTGTPTALLTEILIFGYPAGGWFGNFRAARVITATAVTAAQITAMRAYLRGPNFAGYTGNSYGVP